MRPRKVFTRGWSSLRRREQANRRYPGDDSGRSLRRVCKFRVRGIQGACDKFRSTNSADRRSTRRIAKLKDEQAWLRRLRDCVRYFDVIAAKLSSLVFHVRGFPRTHSISNFGFAKSAHCCRGCFQFNISKRRFACADICFKVAGWKLTHSG